MVFGLYVESFVRRKTDTWNTLKHFSQNADLPICQFSTYARFLISNVFENLLEVNIEKRAIGAIDQLNRSVLVRRRIQYED